MEEIKWIFEPYKRVGPIYFGMTQKEVAAILGKPNKIRGPSPYGKSTKEFRKDNVIYYSAENLTVEQITICIPASVYYKGKNLVDKNLLVQILKAGDDDLYEDVGIVVSYKLGISASGTLPGDVDDDFAVGFFRKGVWDSCKHELSPFKFPD